LWLQQFHIAVTSKNGSICVCFGVNTSFFDALLDSCFAVRGRRPIPRKSFASLAKELSNLLICEAGNFAAGSKSQAINLY